MINRYIFIWDCIHNGGLTLSVNELWPLNENFFLREDKQDVTPH